MKRADYGVQQTDVIAAHAGWNVVYVYEGKLEYEPIIGWLIDHLPRTEDDALANTQPPMPITVWNGVINYFRDDWAIKYPDGTLYVPEIGVMSEKELIARFEANERRRA